MSRALEVRIAHLLDKLTKIEVKQWKLSHKEGDLRNRLQRLGNKLAQRKQKEEVRISL